jgi:hypothetical protein
MTQALNFTEAKIARVIRAARKEGVVVGAVTIHADGSVTVARDAKEDKTQKAVEPEGEVVL